MSVVNGEYNSKRIIPKLYMSLLNQHINKNQIYSIVSLLFKLFNKKKCFSLKFNRLNMLRIKFWLENYIMRRIEIFETII